VIPEIVQVDSQNPAARVADDELVVFLGPPPGAGGGAAARRAPFIRELIDGSVKALTRKHFYLTTYAGFLKPNGGAPYVVLDWKGAGASALERRWVAHRAFGAMSSTFSPKKIAVYLEAGSGAAELALAEDLGTRHMSPRYEKSLLSVWRILTPAPDELRAADRDFETRLKGQLGFRAWVNENPDALTSLEIGARLEAFCRKHGCKFESIDEGRLAQMGMNLLVAVGQAASVSPSRLHIAQHRVKGVPGEKPLMLVGKGITFDTGGINLKPHEGFVNCMKNDMGGAGLVSQLFMALVEAGYPGPLIAVTPCCENLIGERSMKPGAVIKSYAGKDVLIEHTDAEGRLILADAIHYAQKTFSPGLTLVAATLTTASLRQFTNFFTAVHFAPERFQEALARAGKATGEEFSFWGEFLPFAQGNRTNAADLTNMGRMPSHANIGGACNVAAHFLKEFAVEPLVHVDIFASTWNWSGDYPGAHYGATGAPFNALFRAIAEDQGALWGMR
jgi:leucyl aminopeptidase